MSPIQPEAVLRAYPAGAQAPEVEHPVTTGGFSGAHIFRVRLEQRLFCLRCWPQTGPPADRIRGLHRLLQTVSRQGGPPVAVPLINRDGGTLTACGPHWWQLEPWLPGQADFHQRPSSERLSAAMQALAQWHQAASCFQPRPNEEQWFRSHPGAPSPAVLERIDRLGEYPLSVQSRLRRALVECPTQTATEAAEFCELALSGLTAAHTLIPRVHQELRALRHTSFRLQPCLRDVWHDHVLFQGEMVSGLIDASACRHDHVATDIARLVSSLIADDRHSWQAALQAYQSHRTLNLDEQVLVWALDRSGTLLSCLYWITRFVEGHMPANWLPAVSGRLRTMIARLESWSAGC